MVISKKYLKQAQELLSANFRMFGIGHFDLYTEDIAEILSALASEDYKLLQSIYEKLEQQRMG